MAYEGYYDQGASLYGTNPEAAALYRRRKMSEMLAKSGTDTSPAATPLVGVARVAQALLGAYGMYSADKGAEDLGKKMEGDRAASGASLAALMGGQSSQPPSPMAQQLIGQPTQQPPSEPTSNYTTQQLPPAELMPLYKAASEKYGIPVDVLIAQHRQESGFNPNATGAAGEIGLGQIKPSTAQAPGFGVAPVDPATLRDPAKNIDFSAAYLAGRAKAAGVNDWSDPAQRAKGLQAYNGGGDPNYVANVSRYMPQPGGGAPGQMAGPGAPPSGALPSMPQGQQPQTPAADPRIAQSQQLTQWGLRASQHPDPRIQAQGKIALQQADQLERQVEAQRVREDARNNRTPQHVTLGDPDGKGSSVWILGPDGQPKQRVGAAPNGQHAPQHITMQDPDGKSVGIYATNPDGTPGARIGAAPKQPGEGAGPFSGNAMEAQANNTLLGIGPKIQNGTASDAERNQYALAYEHLSQGRIMPVPDPTDPTGQRQVLARIPGAVPEQFPKPGGGGTAVAGPGAGGSPTGPEVIPGTTKNAPAMTEAQGKVATFADRIASSMPIIEDTTEAGLSRTQQMLGGVPIFGNSLISNDTQKLEQAQRNFINAVLRRESGAVISPEEFDNARKQYFPQPGDGKDVLEQKRKNRQDVHSGFAREAGPSYVAPKAPEKPAAGHPAPPPGFKVID